MIERIVCIIPIISILTASSCSHEKVVLQPAAHATNPAASASNALLKAVDTVNGVKVTVTTQQWPGNQQVRNHVTPLKVTIQNNGKQPTMIRYGNFALVSEDGDHYAAIPPFNVEGEIEKPVIVGDYRFTPILDADGYAVAPYYRSPYKFPVYESVYYYDPLYYRTYHVYWRTRSEELPTTEMLQRAIPEGVVRPGGRISGFLYFDAVDPGNEKVTFRGTLTSPDTGKNLGTVTIPLSVREANP